MKSAPEWIPKSDQVSPQNAPMVSTINHCIFNFSYQKIDLSIDQPAQAEISQAEMTRFSEQVGLLTSIVIEQLGLKVFPRIGIRSWHLFPCQDQDEAESLLAGLGVYSVSPRIAETFGGRIESTGVSIVVAGDELNFRLGLNGVERAAMLDLGSEIMALRASSLSKGQDQAFRQKQKQSSRIYSQPQFAAMIDIDCYQNDPESIDPEDFVRNGLSESRRRLEKTITKQDKGGL